MNRTEPKYLHEFLSDIIRWEREPLVTVVTVDGELLMREQYAKEGLRILLRMGFARREVVEIRGKHDTIVFTVKE